MNEDEKNEMEEMIDAIKVLKKDSEPNREESWLQWIFRLYIGGNYDGEETYKRNREFAIKHEKNSRSTKGHIINQFYWAIKSEFGIDPEKASYQVRKHFTNSELDTINEVLIDAFYEYFEEDIEDSLSE